MILISHPTANQNVRQTALALAEAGLLAEFWTGVNWDEESVFGRYLPIPARVRRELRRRSFARVLQPFIRSFGWREWGRLLSAQLGLSGMSQYETSPFSMDAVYYSLDRRVARRLSAERKIKAVYAYDNGALESFRAAKLRGLTCVYEHPVVYWRRVREYQREEAELHPEWASTLGALGDSNEKLTRKDQELALADVVITASRFAKQSLKDVPCLKAPIRVIAYGAPPINRSRMADEHGPKLRVLFVGALSQAKGLGYLLQAASRLERQIELTLIGHRVSPVMPQPAVLNRYRWIPSLAHDDLLAQMSQNDVLVLPSLHEGFGLVMLEAMAHGLVVITTPHTAGPDIITEGVNGFIVPIRSAESIEERLIRLITDKNLLVEMKLAAQRKAEMVPWESYRHELGSMARALIQRTEKAQ